MYTKLCFLFGFAVVVLSACGPTSTATTVTTKPGMLTSPTKWMRTPTMTATPTTTPATTPTATITSTPTTILITMPPADAYTGWLTFETSDFTIKYPPSYYIPPQKYPVILIADTKNTLDSWMQTDSAANNRLLIQLISLNLDRRLDPFSDPSPLATVEQALQREINRAVGISYYVSGATDVQWENANGGTADGRKVFYPNVAYQNVLLGTTKAAKVISENMIYYFILDPSDDSYYVRISIQPANSTLRPGGRSNPHDIYFYSLIICQACTREQASAKPTEVRRHCVVCSRVLAGKNIVTEIKTPSLCRFQAIGRC